MNRPAHNITKQLADALRPFADLLFEPAAMEGQTLQLYVSADDVSRANEALAALDAWAREVTE